MICRIIKNITTPIPSLNKDSPTIFISILLGTFAFVRMPSTAMGSVGDIRTPNNKH
jgi:hypothetical protein